MGKGVKKKKKKENIVKKKKKGKNRKKKKKKRTKPRNDRKQVHITLQTYVIMLLESRVVLLCLQTKRPKRTYYPPLKFDFKKT